MIQRIVILLLVFSVAVTGFSTDKLPTKWCRELKGYADTYYESGLYDRALEVYMKLIARHPDYDGVGEWYLRSGVCLLHSPDPDGSMAYFEKALELEEWEAWLHIGQYYHRKEQFDEALDAYWRYKNHVAIDDYTDEADRYIDITLTAKNMIKNPVSVQIENLGDNVNSQYPDYVPVVSADESVLIFTSRRRESNGGQDTQGVMADFYENVYISHKEQGEWTAARSIGNRINTRSHDACVGISPDGNELFIYRANEFGWGDLYTSRLENGAWSEPEKIKGGVNSEWWEPSASITPDNRVLYFSSNRPGGMGGRDIYRSVKSINGEWGEPVNLGPVINTQYDEDAPYIHPDGRTLYFSSKGHKNMGGFDVFRSVMDEDGNWSFPQNLGYPINTVHDDIYFVVSGDGERGYYASAMEGGIGEKDIYVVHFSGETLPITLYKGAVLSEAGDPVAAVITVLDTASKKVKGIYRTNPGTGSYLLILPPGKYMVLVEADAYHPFSEDVSIDDERFVEKEKNFRLSGK